MGSPSQGKPDATVSLHNGVRPRPELGELSTPKAELPVPGPAAETPCEMLTKPLRKSRSVPTIREQREPQESETALLVSAEQACPKCGGKLVNPGSLGLCPACGYCQSLEDGGAMPAPASAPDRQFSHFGWLEFCRLAVKLPIWLYVFLTGIGLIVLGSSIADSFFLEDALLRAIWGTIQLIAGIVAAVVAHEWALFCVVPHDERIGAGDALMFSARVWKLTIKKMPATRCPVCLVAWGFTLIISAILLVGGMTYWLPGRHG